MVVILIAAVLLSGCATVQPSNAPDVFPQLIQQEPLPPWPFHAIEQEVTLDIKIRIGSDGSVKDVVFLTPSLSRDWNALALEKIRQWKFSPALVDGRPIALWIRQTLRMRFEEAVYVRLAEIVCSNQQTADSVYTLLDAGAPFDSLAMAVSVSGSRTKGGFLGDVDLRTLPLFVRYKLQKLPTNHCTSPISLGRNYVIFKCLPAGPRPFLPG
jgi:TonB family protein